MRDRENGDAWSRKFLRSTCAAAAQLTGWADFSHDHARSRTYRWGEDGIAGVSDTHSLQNIAFTFWNEKE